MPENFGKLYEAIEESVETMPEWLSSPQGLVLICAAIMGVILWMILHSVFVRPFVLVGVLRNYIQSGMDDIPSEESFAMLDSKSARFRKLRAEEGV